MFQSQIIIKYLHSACFFFAYLHFIVGEIPVKPEKIRDACESLGSKRRPSWRPNVGTSMTVMARAIKKKRNLWPEMTVMDVK